jgi:catechol 2,3-dioxygenase-like lactoylglutathione lyase family enzyme
MGGQVGIGVTQITHVKLPVTNLQRSASWYQALFDLELIAEFAESGEVRGVSLLDRDGDFELALRQREYCVGAPRLNGFDVFALRSPTEELLASIAERCDRLGIKHTGIGRAPGYGAALDIPDPDGTLVRIVWHDPRGPAARSTFLGIETGPDGTPRPYYEPRLALAPPTHV